MADDQSDVLTLTAEIVAYYVGNASHVNANDIPAIIKSVRAALSEGDAPEAEAAPSPTPKMHGSQVKKSITPDALIRCCQSNGNLSLRRASVRLALGSGRAAHLLQTPSLSG